MGVQPAQPSPQLIVSVLGGAFSLMVISTISWLVLGSRGAAALVPSMGAATVLLFVVPHAPLSQPWALFVGNLISAVIGVAVARYVPHLAIASGLAVGVAIGAMILTRSSHPPGGATALAAVIGGAKVEALGFTYVLYPVLLNCIVIFLFALFFNNLFGWRRYPQALMRYKFVSLSPEAMSTELHLDQRDFQLAMKQMAKRGQTLDVSAEQVDQVYLHALKIKESQSLASAKPLVGEHYSNNEPGARWSVRRVTEIAEHPDPVKRLVVYKVIDGDEKGRVDSCSLVEFLRWARARALPVAKVD